MGSYVAYKSKCCINLLQINEYYKEIISNQTSNKLSKNNQGKQTQSIQSLMSCKWNPKSLSSAKYMNKFSILSLFRKPYLADTFNSLIPMEFTLHGFEKTRMQIQGNLQLADK